MNFKQKLRFLILAGVLFWLVMLLGYINHHKNYLRNYKWVLNHAQEPSERQRIIVEDAGEGSLVEIQPNLLPPSSSPSSSTLRKFSVKLVEIVTQRDDDDMSEVLYNDKTISITDQPKSSTKKFHSRNNINPYSGPENVQQEQIVAAFLHAWAAYRKYAWGSDELKPLSKTGMDWLDVGLTIVDSLDTLYIMGLKEEFGEGRAWVANHLKADQNTAVQFFEIVIRLLGGLLSSYHLSNDKIFLDKAVEFGKVFKECFQKHHKLPCHRIHIRNKMPVFDETNLAEVGTIQLEFRDLARSSGDSQYEESAAAVSSYLHSLPKIDGLTPCIFTRVDDRPLGQSVVSMGARADSYYEYLLKQWLQTGKTISWLEEDFTAAVRGAVKHLLKYSSVNKLAYLGTSPLSDGSPVGLDHTMEHLTCFLPGTLALGHMNGLPSSILKLAKDLMKTCYQMYEQSPLGLSPESANFGWTTRNDRDFSIDSSSRYNIHRPETVESLYYMYKATKDPVYRKWGWNIFQAFENYTKLDEGYAGIQNVDAKNRESIIFIDKMETFYLAEMLKYLYLLFSDRADLLPLDEWVFNTEAHPLPIYDH